MPTPSDGKDQHDRGIVLKHVGHLFLPDVPGRDLTADDIQAAPYTKAELIKSGVYIAADAPAEPKAEKPAAKAETPKE